MSAYRKGSDSERDLEKWLWNRGMATARQAGSGSVPHESADIWAADETGLYIFEVKTISDPPVDVSKDSRQLRELYDRVSNIRAESYVAFALNFESERGWKYAPYHNNVIGNPGDYDYIYNLLNDGDYSE